MRPTNFALKTTVLPLQRRINIIHGASLKTVGVGSWLKILLTTVSISWTRAVTSSALLTTKVYSVQLVYVWTLKTIYLCLSSTQVKWRKWNAISKYTLWSILKIVLLILFNQLYYLNYDFCEWWKKLFACLFTFTLFTFTV